MTPGELLAEVVRAGGRVVPDLIRPRLLVPPALKALVLEHRDALRAVVGDIAAVVALPLATFAETGQPLEVRVPWWSQTLWLVPDERHAGILAAEGISRGRIWTASELTDLMTSRDPESARLIAIVKLEFNGEVVEVRDTTMSGGRPALTEEEI